MSVHLSERPPRDAHFQVKNGVESMSQGEVIYIIRQKAPNKWVLLVRFRGWGEGGYGQRSVGKEGG